MTIRPETPRDRDAIRVVNEAAFQQTEEADLVDRLRTDGAFLLSLVADLDAFVIGHILFTRMWIGDTPAVALAPVSVQPSRQRQGVGDSLIRAGLDKLRGAAERIVVVVGHPGYYPRFGFSTSLARSFEHPFPPDVCMALELVPGALDGVAGRLRYAAAFGL